MKSIDKNHRCQMLTMATPPLLLDASVAAYSGSAAAVTYIPLAPSDTRKSVRSCGACMSEKPHFLSILLSRGSSDAPVRVRCESGLATHASNRWWETVTVPGWRNDPTKLTGIYTGKESDLRDGVSQGSLMIRGRKEIQ